MATLQQAGEIIWARAKAKTWAGAPAATSTPEERGKVAVLAGSHSHYGEAFPLVTTATLARVRTALGASEGDPNSCPLLALLSPDDPHRLGPMARLDDRYHFLDRAFEYYLTGRFAALNNLQVAGNLLHHAVEMLAKFQLLRLVPADRLAEQVKKLKQKPYGHDLQTLWSDFKAAVGHSSLDRFDAVVVDLNRWEDLRYGGYPVGIPTTLVFMPRRGPHETWSAEPQDEYVLVLEDVDELFTAMMAAAGINPAFLGERYRLKPAMREWYAKSNVHAMVNVFRIDPQPGTDRRLRPRHCSELRHVATCAV